MINRTLRLVIFTGLLIAIISLTPGSAIDFGFQGRFVLSDAIGENNLLFRSVSSSQYVRGPRVPPGHLFTFQKRSRMLRIVDPPTPTPIPIPAPIPTAIRAHLVLASSDMAVVKKIYTLSNRQSILKQVRIEWDEFFPNLCLISTDAHDGPDPWYDTPPGFADYINSCDSNGLAPITNAGSVPKYQIISFPVNFAFVGLWSCYQANRPAASSTSFLHHRIDNKYVLRLENQKILTLGSHYSRAYVALVNAELNWIKSIVVLDRHRINQAEIPLTYAYPNICLLRADQGEEGQSGPHPKTFTDHQDWLRSIHASIGVFMGNAPLNVPRWEVYRVGN